MNSLFDEMPLDVHSKESSILIGDAIRLAGIAWHNTTGASLGAIGIHLSGFTTGYLGKSVQKNPFEDKSGNAWQWEKAHSAGVRLRKEHENLTPENDSQIQKKRKKKTVNKKDEVQPLELLG